MILILITVLLTIIIVSIYFKTKKENFTNFNSNNDVFRKRRSDYKIDSISMNNIFNDETLLDKQKKFDIYINQDTIKKTDYYNANVEISVNSLQNIFNLFISKKHIDTKFKGIQKYKYKYYDNTEIPYINNEIYENMKNNFKSKLNNYIQDFFYKNHLSGEDNRKFQIINDTILDYKENNEYIKTIFLLNIYRKLKYNGFQVYCLCYFNKKDQKFHFKKIKIYGIIESQDIYLLPGHDQKNKENLKIYSSNYPYTSYGGENTYLRTSEISRILPSKKQLTNILKNNKKKRILDFIDRSFQCYGSEGDDVYNCLSDLNNLNQYKKPGIWDRPCYTNEECPFYKANKNYDNNRGGCLNGFCEMPLNIQNLTYRHYNKITKPFCYNCKNNTNNCCDTQMKENPKLLSPDYTFAGDKIERYNNRKQLEEKGLKWYTINQNSTI